MNERVITLHTYISGTLGGNHTIADEFPFPVRLLSVKASASNNSDATLAVADEDSATVITAAVIGDSADMAQLEPDSAALTAGYDQLAQDKRMIFTLDYDGSGGTAAQNVNILRNYLVGESA